MYLVSRCPRRGAFSGLVRVLRQAEYPWLADRLEDRITEHRLRREKPAQHTDHGKSNASHLENHCPIVFPTQAIVRGTLRILKNHFPILFPIKAIVIKRLISYLEKSFPNLIPYAGHSKRLISYLENHFPILFPMQTTVRATLLILFPMQAIMRG